MCQICKRYGAKETLCRSCLQPTLSCMSECDSVCKDAGLKCSDPKPSEQMFNDAPGRYTTLSCGLTVPTPPPTTGGTKEKEEEKCPQQAADRQAAAAAYALLEINGHRWSSFAADVLFGNFAQCVGDKTAANPLSPGDFSHEQRCKVCNKNARMKWCEHPLELWEKRTFDLHELGPAVEKIRDNLTALLGLVPNGMQELMSRRFEHLSDVVTLSVKMHADYWRDLASNKAKKQPSHVEGLTKQIVRLRHCQSEGKRISNRLPTQLTQQPGFVCLDERQNPWGDLRGEKSLVSAMSVYMTAEGADYEVICEWLENVSGNSWKPIGVATKAFWAFQRLGGNELPGPRYFWKDGDKDALGQYSSLLQRWGAKWAMSWQIWHAFTQELLAATNIEGSDRNTKTVQLIRTEDGGVMQAEKVDYGTGRTMRRGASESASIFSPPSVGGYHITIQQVPHHRVIACYFPERMPNLNTCAFKSDDENEFVYLPQGLAFEYASSLPKKPGAKEEDKYAGLFD